MNGYSRCGGLSFNGKASPSHSYKYQFHDQIKILPVTTHALLSVTFATESHWLSPHNLVEWLS